MSSAPLRVALPLLVAVAACKVEHGNDTPRASAVRNDAVSVTLPSDPLALAHALAVPVDSLAAAGEERYNRQEYDSARAIWEVEVTRARHANDRQGEARARMWLGLANWRLGDFKRARQNGEGSVAMKRALGLDSELSRSFNALGLLAWQEGRYRDALAQFDSAVATAKRNSDEAGVARAASNIPLVEVELGEFDAARAGFTAAITVGERTKNDRLEGNALANLAMLEIRLGNGARALPLLASARRHYAKIEYATGEANALGQLATAFSELGDLQHAIAAADSGLVIARAEGLQQEVAATLEVRADLEAQAGNLRRSLQTLYSADSLDRALGLALESGANQRRMATILTGLGEPTLAVTRARQALAAHLRVSARNEEAYDRMQLAYSLALSGDTAEASRQADAALRISTEIRNPAAARDAGGIAAHLALVNGSPGKALAYLDMIGKEQMPVDWRLADLRALALLRLGRVREARVEGNKSLRALERERASLGDGPLRAGYLASRAAPFSHMIEINLTAGDTAAAFAVAASLPGRSLSERLAGVTNPPAQLAIAVRREDLLLRIAALERELDDTRNHDDPPEKQAALERSLQFARGAFEDQIDREAVTPGTASAIGVQLSSVQRSLGPNQTLLLLVPGPENLDVFAVASHRVFHSTARVGTQSMLRRVQLVREFLQMGGDFSRISKPLGELFDLLVRPAIDARMLTPGGEVSIATAGPLSALPFAALWDKSIGHLLVEDYAISYLPSLVQLLRPLHQTYATLRSPSIFAPLPDSLPGTKAEARAIANVYPSASLLVGHAATERGFRSALRADRVIHVASHGSYNLQNPLFSRIAVGTAGSQSPENDGRLEVHEILGLTTRSPLVFLSGCETAGSGTAAFGGGADEVSLAHAFLIAGAGAVVATRWMIDDATAAQIGGSFYRELKSGNSPGQALAIAQRQALRNRKNLTWAAYSVFGPPSRNSARDVRTTSGGI